MPEAAAQAPRLFTVLGFIFKILPISIAGMAIYLGYKLFVLGVTGEASIVIDATTIRGQLINAAPGLFFAVGGLVALIVIVIKGAMVVDNKDGDQSWSV